MVLRKIAWIPLVLALWCSRSGSFVHAGAILWLADVCATALVLGSPHATEGQKGFPLAISLSGNFASNQSEGTFKAVSSFVKKGKTVSIVRTEVYGKEDKLIADVTTNHVLAK